MPKLSILPVLCAWLLLTTASKRRPSPSELDAIVADLLDDRELEEEIVSAMRIGKESQEIVAPKGEETFQAKRTVDKRNLAGDVDISALVNVHNKFRRQEGASNMQEISYSPYLADMASEWALRCDFNHGHPPRTDPPYNWIGQNLYALSVPKLNFTRAVVSWYSEKRFYNYDARTCAPGYVCGHYTAVVWWESNKIGCGYAICPSLGGTSFTNAAYIVCNYGPGGNYVSEYPFLKGPACSKCPAGYSCNLGLCKAP